MNTTKDTLELLTSWGLSGYQSSYQADFDFDNINPDDRTWFADGEDLAEGGIAAWLDELRPYLESQGVTLAPIEDVEVANKYCLLVNGRTITVSENVGPDHWYRASVCAARIVNWLLETANSTERCYLLYVGANDGDAVFIHQDTYRQLIASPELNPRDKPEDFGSLDAPKSNQ